MTTRKALHLVLSLAVIVSLCLPAAGAAASHSEATDVASLPAQTRAVQPDSGLFRTRVTVDSPTRWGRLEAMDVVILERSADSALLLVDGEQLETLARLRFEPRANDELGLLVHAQAPERAWLLESLQPLLDQGIALQARLAVETEGEASQTQRQSLRAAMQALTPEQIAAIGDSFSVDDDGDGLTNTEEAWWCTDPMNTNSDGDTHGYTDGQEVAALLDFSLPRSVRWGYGPPFGPPAAWPDFNGADGNPNTPACNDGDWDTIPDYAEAYVVGTRVGTGNSENTDGDKFDDGQEFFGITYCPGGSATCGYGSYPRTQDYSFITSGMPSWVRPPGDSPFVAAYPVIDFLVDPATVRVVAKEIRTIERTITQGEEISTGFAETTGSSTTVGTIDTNTHSTWQENSTTEGGIEPQSIADSVISMNALATIQHPEQLVYSADPEVLPANDESRTIVMMEPLPPVNMAPPTLPFSESIENTTQDALTAAQEMLPPSDYFAVSAVREEEGWQFVSVVGLKGLSEDLRWTLQDNATWFGLVLIYTDYEGKIYSAVEGSMEFSKLLDKVPDHILSASVRVALDPLRRQLESSAQQVFFPMEPNKLVQFGSKGVHNAGYGDMGWGTSSWAAVDLLSEGTSGQVSDKVLAATAGSVVGPVCNDGTSVAIKTADFIYAHLLNNGNLVTGHEFRRGAEIGRLKHGDFPGTCGYADNPGDDGFHLHWGFANSGQLQVGSWTLTWDTGKVPSPWDTRALWKRAGTGETKGVKAWLATENSVATPGPDACYALGMTQPVAGQSAQLNQQQKPISWSETIGKLFRGFIGKLTRSGNQEALTLAPNNLAGCSGNSCADQVRYSTNNSLNFSDNRSGGQCSSAGGSPGGDSNSGFGGGGAGIAINNNGDGTWDRLRVWSQTTTTGEGYSTSHSELRSQTEYREVTRSQTNTLVSSEAWSTATTVDPTDAATLTFNYNLYNSGSDAAVQLTGIRINILIGDLPVITWNAPDRANILPGQAKGPFSSDPIHLTLEQLAAIDNGAPIRVVLADYGYNDNLYDQDAWGRGVLFHVDDGIADDDESSDTYLITASLVQGETYQDVLARYFPVEVFDAGPNDPRTGTLTNIRTPEFDANGEITGWNDHRVGQQGWWELAISLGGETDGVSNFKDMPAKPRTDVYLRYVEDSDSDGYSDRAEIAGNSDPNNPDIHPRPLLTAAQHTEISGGTATVQLALQNIGNFDASSVEVWAVAPDDSITLTDNLIGGGGRVRAGGHVVLGARTGNLNLANWTTSTAKPYPAGQYTGLAAKTFTLRANTNGNIGSSTGLTISWSTNGTTWTPLSVGSGYTALTPLALSDGLTVAFSTGYIAQNETFSFQAALPIDTFSYTINRTPHTPPLIVVSYNDPAGNHKFVSDVEVTPIQADLTGYLGQMRYGFELDIMADEPAAAGTNTAYLVFNNPSDRAISEGKLFVEFAKPDGTVVKEYVLTDQTFQPGPNVAMLPWNTADFNPAYDPASEYHILVFAADRQGTIFENTVKKLAQVGHDQLPLAVLPDSTWDFGTAQQGTLLQHTIAVANVGYHDLLTFVQGNPGFTLSDSGTRHVATGDLVLYDLTLNIGQLAVGPYQSALTIRTSDPTQPTKTVQVTGMVTAAPADTSPGAVQRPLDWPATVSGTQGQWVEFTHTLGPTPETLHPVKVYSQHYGTLWGVGRYATPFSTGTAPGDMFGDGRDGVMPSSGNLDNNNGVGAGMVNSGSAGAYSVNVTDVYAGWRINPGDMVLIHQTQGAGAGCWELNKAVSDYVGGTTAIQLAKPLQCNYASGGNNHAQIQRVPQYTNCPISGTVTPLSGWNGSWGGILSFMCNGTMNLSGALNVAGGNGSVTSSTTAPGGTGGGFRGGSGNRPPSGSHVRPYTGEGYPGPSLQGDSDHGGAGVPTNGNAGTAAAFNNGGLARSGGGGSYGTSGNPGTASQAGMLVGDSALSSLYFGGGGGGGGRGEHVGQGIGGGGAGGGAVVVFARSLAINGGTITARGGNAGVDTNTSGQGQEGGGASGGAGAGGAIWLRVGSANIGGDRILATGGTGTTATSGRNGAGGSGRIRVEYCETLTGSTNPAASTQKLTCYIAEQVESSPYNRTRLNLPSSGANTYQLQYGRKLNWSGAANQVTTLRVPAGLFTSVTLQALVSDLPSNAWFALDVGNTGSDSWNGTVGNGGQYTSPNLAPFFNSYWASHGAPTTGYLDVPVRVHLDRAGQVLLTNMQVTPTGSKLRHVRLSAQNYTEVILGLTAGQSGSGALTVAADVGDNGSVDWTWTGNATYPKALTTANLAAAINAYLQGQSGEVDVPIRFYISPFVDVSLQTLTATPTGQPDLSMAAADISFSPSVPVEGDTVTVTATVRNPGSLASGPLTASFFATLPDSIEWYIGSAFIPSVPPGASASAQIEWNTLGFTGDVPVRVVVDPYNRVTESNENNNQASKPITILTRPDLKITAIELSDDEPVTGQTVDITLTLANSGQTGAPASTLALYDGMPDSGGTLTCQSTPAAPANGSVNATCTWTPAGPGLHRLYAVADEDGVVNESDKSNNTAWSDIHVGFAGPLLLDSGSSTNDPIYATATGYGVVDEGQPDIIETCGDGAAPEDTLRRDPDGRLVYRFDHLQPGHFYHLDVTLRQCDNIPRQERVYIDNNLVAGPVDLGDTQARYLSLLLDPALYADHAISIAVEASGGDGALVAEVNLHDIDYRYADAGGSRDPQHPGVQGYGWLDGVASSAWGSLPYQTARINHTGNQQRYRFDGLQPGKRYTVNLTYYQSSGTGRIQRAEIDGLNTGLTVNTSDYVVHRERVYVPRSTYTSDGSIIVRTVRSDAGTTGAMINEISLEELTLRTPEISLSPASIAVTQPPGIIGTESLSVDNLGVANLTWTLTEAPSSCSTPGNVTWLSVNPTSGVTVAGGSSTLDLSLDSRGLAVGTYTARLCIASNDLDQPTISMPVQLTVTPASSGPVQLYLNPASATVATGETFTLDVMVNTDAQPINNVELYISFDPAKLQVVDLAGNPASTVIADLAALNIELLNSADNSAGLIRYDAGRLTGAPPTGVFRVASIPFKALAESANATVSYLPDTDVFYNGASVLGGSSGASIVIQAGCLEGQVTLQSHPTPAGYASIVSIYTLGGTSPLATYNTTLNSSSRFTICGMAPGAFDVMVKGPHSLGSRRAGVVIPSGSAPVNFCTLYEGDANGDNRVSTIDFSVLASAYNTCTGNAAFDARADFNDDTCVRGVDFSLQASNYNRLGPTACTGLETGDAANQLQGAVSLAFEPSGKVAGVGDIFTLALMVQAGMQPLNNVELYIDFDPTVLQVVDTAGNPVSSIEPDLTTFETLLYNSVDNTGGHIRYDAGHLAATAPTGAFRIAQVRFKRLASTDTTLVRIVPPSDAFYVGSSVGGPLGQTPVATVCPNFQSSPVVGVDDIQILTGHWGLEANSPGWDPRYDLNSDGRIDLSDLMRVVAFWNAICG